MSERMRRVLGVEQLGAALDRSVVTVGKFFGVHRGHHALLQATVAAARRHQAPSVVLTFDRHPAEVLYPGQQFPEIASLPERLQLIEAQGIAVTVVARLTPEFLSLEPEAFVREILVQRLGAAEVLAGENFRFGRKARGDLSLLRRLGAELGFACTAVPPVLEGGAPISSSRIAECIAAGRVTDAASQLGRPYSVAGQVQPGAQLGRKLGFPTANVRTEPNRLLPADGVYVVRLNGLPAVANVGVRPTVDGRQRLLEVHLLGWQGDLYGQEVTVQFLGRLRDEMRFPDLAALQAQITADADKARAYFSGS